VKRDVITLPAVIHQRVELCGCVVTERPGHALTKLCAQHRREIFNPNQVEPDNLDLVGG